MMRVAPRSNVRIGRARWPRSHTRLSSTGVSRSRFSHDAACRAAERAAREQRVPGDTTSISYKDKGGRWHDEVSLGNDRPETGAKG